MKIGLFAINYGTCADPEQAVRVAQHAEAAGFESVWTGEHLVLPDPAPPGFSMPPTLPLLDTVVALTLIAAHTSTIKLGSGIIVLPLRNPVVLAKELASVDVVSAGRLIAGFGAGYVPAEFAAVGVPLAERGARTADYVRALRALWSMDRPEYHGRYADFDSIDTYPRPVQRPGPPIVLGGGAPAALRRAVQLADGWYGFGLDPAAVGECVAALHRLHEQRPAELSRLSITVTPSGPLTKATVEQYAELGVDRLVLLPRPDAPHRERHRPVPVEQILSTIDHVADELITS